ncbi:MAG: hypothetical protein EBZ99_06360, partial [Actinobacteria bacterium]|nr:hypothetical protein [Actinomycetota bacterium]
MTTASRNHLINRRQLIQLSALVAAISSKTLSPLFAATDATPRLILGRPTKNSVALSIISNREISAYIEYGTSKTKYSGKSAIQKILS